MIESKGWDWEKVSDSLWLKPIEDSYFLANKWKEKGYKSILDLGSGLGRHSIYFSKQGFDVNAVDISEYGIEHLKSWAKREKLNIHASVKDFLSMDFNDNSFDCVFACHVISHTDRQGMMALIKDIERILKHNGEVFLTFCSKSCTDFLAPNAQRVDENTIISNQEPEIGIPHYHVDLIDIIDLLKNFNIEKIRHLEYCNITNPMDTKKSMYYYVNATLK
jgi:SAM-dependent methyltransferase